MTIHLIDEFKIGGAQTHLVTVLREIVRTESPSSYMVISLFGGGGIEDELRMLGVRVTVLDFRASFAKKRHFETVSVLQAMFRELQPKAVVAHLTWSRLLGLFAAWRARVPVRIGFEQGDLYLASPPFRLANFIGQLFTDRIVVCSRALGDWVHRTHGVSRKKLVVLHNCVDLRLFQPRCRESWRRSEWDMPPERTVFCAVGTLGNGVNKRVDVSIRAIARARALGADVSLVVCGDGAQRPELERLTRDLGVGTAVRFLGTQRDVPGIMSACDAFCHAAPFEPFGIVCIEAMAMQLPVAVPDSGGIAEAVEDGLAGRLYPALDQEALARIMCSFHGDSARCLEMGRAGRSVVEQRFSSVEYVRRLSEVLNPHD